MDVELLFRELQAVADHVGTLEDAVAERAATILYMPRYALGGPALLAKDLERVITTIEPDTRPKLGPEPEWYSRYFQRYARRFFLLEANDEQLERRRTFGSRDRKGTTITWMNRGVIYRVAAGLIDLWAEETSLGEAHHVMDAVGGYEIETLWATRLVKEWSMKSGAFDKLEFDIRLVSTGPHILFLPWTRKAIEWQYSSNAEIPQPRPQLITADQVVKKGAAVIFGAGQAPDTHLRLRFCRYTGEKRRWVRYEIAYNVIHPVRRMSFEIAVQGETRTDRRWEARTVGPLAGDYTTIEHSAGNPWICDYPEPGHNYALTGCELWEWSDDQGQADSPDEVTSVPV